MVSKKKFVRDIMSGLDERRCIKKEAEAKSIINQDKIVADYMQNKRYLHGRKATAQGYQT